MRINKLYSLNHFLDLIKIEKRPDGGKLYDIFEYHKFLNQFITEEMFVNYIEKPNMRDECYVGNYDLWQEAEKKIIFDYEYSAEIHIRNKEIVIIKGFEFYLNRTTIYELAEKLNGYDVKLKNVEI